MGAADDKGAIRAAQDGLPAVECTAAECAARSRAALDAPLAAAASVRVAVVRDDALVLGAFVRATPDVLRGTARDRPLACVRRGSGGPAVRVGPGTVHVLVAFADPARPPLAVDPARIVNRAVRPLLRALTRAGSPAHFFGRDWVAVRHRPAAWVGFAHDSTTRRAAFEAFVAVDVPFVEASRASFRGREPGTLASIGGRPVDPAAVAAAIAAEYAQAFGGGPAPAIAGAPAGASTGIASWGADASTDIAASGAELSTDVALDEPPWAATCEETIGTIGGGFDRRHVFRVGGDWLVSRDAASRLEDAVAKAGPGAESATLGAIVDQSLAAPGVVLDGVRSLANVLDVIERALRAPPAPRSAPP